MNRLTKKIGKGYLLFEESIKKPIQAVDKLGQLEDIEEELGCPIELYFKMCVFGTELYSKPHIDVKQWFNKYIYHKDKNNDVCFCVYIDKTLTPIYYYKDYGKTWALVEEDLSEDDEDFSQEEANTFNLYYKD